MWRYSSVALLVGLLLGCGADAPTAVEAEPALEEPRHVVVYHEAGKYGGWPANHGIWSWGDEILVGFTVGDYLDMGDSHHINRETPELHFLGRSMDGGETWTVRDPGKEGYLIPEGGFLQRVERTDVEIPKAREPEGGVEFSHPDFAMTVRTTDINSGSSRFFYSYDRGKVWEGPFLLPNFGAPGTAARTDYIVNGKDDCFAFITAAKQDGDEGRPMCIRTRDGGKTWTMEGWIGPEPEGFSIMPATVRLDDGALLTAVRRREGERRWIAAYRSEDEGKTWEYLNDPVEDAGIGNPAAMIKLRDGRLALAYGFRGEPYSIRGKLSDDEGMTWGDDVVLRDDGGDRDVGYPRMVQRADGKLVVVYYFNSPSLGPERFIGATIWDAGRRED